MHYICYEIRSQINYIFALLKQGHISFVGKEVKSELPTPEQSGVYSKKPPFFGSYCGYMKFLVTFPNPSSLPQIPPCLFPL